MIKNDFKIFDAHFHSYGIFLEKGKSIIDYLDENNVDKAIITTINRAAKIDPKNIEDHNEKSNKSGSLPISIPTEQLDHQDVIEISKQEPERFYKFFWFNPKMEPDDEERSYRILEDHFNRGFCGIKIQPSIHLIKIPRDIIKLVSFMQDYDRNFPIFIHQSPKFSFYSGTSTKDLAKLAETFPDLQIILGHAALAMELAIDISYNLKKYNNIVFETSCSIPLGILSLIRNIGHHRVIFGSDAPTTNPLSLEIEKILCLPISNDQKQEILYNNIDNIMNK